MATITTAAANLRGMDTASLGQRPASMRRNLQLRLLHAELTFSILAVIEEDGGSIGLEEEMVVREEEEEEEEGENDLVVLDPSHVSQKK